MPDRSSTSDEGHHYRLHHATRYALRCHLHGPGARAPAVDWSQLHRETTAAQYHQVDQRLKQAAARPVLTAPPRIPGDRRRDKGEDRRLHRRLRHQPRQQREDPDLGRRLRADGLRHRRRSWPSRLMTNATSSSPASFDLPIRQVVQPAARVENRRTRRLERGFHVRTVPPSIPPRRRPARRSIQAKAKSPTELEEGGPGPQGRALQTPRLALQPPAVLGRAVPHPATDPMRPDRASDESELPVLLPEMSDFTPASARRQPDARRNPALPCAR